MSAKTKPAAVFQELDLTLFLPSDIASSYKSQARKRKISLEELLAERLSSCVSHNSQSGIYFDDGQRAQLEKLCGGGFQATSAGKALEFLSRALSVRISTPGKVHTIKLDPVLVKRLQTRTFRRKLSELIEEKVVQSLEEFCNL